MKRGVVIGLIVLLALCFVIVKYQPDLKLSASTINARVVDEIQANDNVRVVVKLKTDEVVDGKEIASENVKDDVSDVLKGKIKNEFDDKISAVISEEDLEALENNDNIESVEVVGTRSISLEDSVPLTDSDDVWDLQLNDVNLNGEGQAVCIIDTGVDYTHEDLGGCFGEGCKVVGGYDFCADDATCTSVDEDPMDAHGHGTHVSGIAVANGDGNESVKGMAPGANLVMVKASNSSGTFWDDDLEKAIEWCVTNAEEYNIKVISMSLGGGLFSDYCDVEDPLSDEIDNAVANNISVVVATGNNGNVKQISGPACVKSATPVAGSTKTDEIYSKGNRNDLVSLLAPAVNIKSTIPGNNYAVLTGTSMSAPHVAGAIALVSQYLELTEQVYTPSEIEKVLSDTGVDIEDSESKLTFKRISLYDAIISLDSQGPAVTLVSPEDNFNTESSEQTFSCEASDLLEVSGITFSLLNQSGDLIKEEFSNTSSIEVNVANLTTGVYTWNCLASDEKGNNASADEDYTLIVGSMQVTLDSPEDDSYISDGLVNFSCSVTNAVSEILDVSFYLWNTDENNTLLDSEIVENLSGNSYTGIFEYNLTEEGSYLWNCYSTDESSNVLYSEDNFTLNYDLTSPVVTLVSPENGVQLEDTSANFEYTVVDENEIENCSLLFGGVIQETDDSVSIGSNSFSGVNLEDDHIYSWQIDCLDEALNRGLSSSWNVEVDAGTDNDDDDDSDSDSDDDSDSSSDSGGGGANPAPTGAVSYVIADADLKQGATKNLGQDSQMRFKIKEEYHSLKLNGLTVENVNITISSEPINLLIEKGATEKVDFDDDKIYDLSVTFEAIEDAKAKIKIQSIQEEVGTRDISDNETISDDTSSSGITGKGILEALPLSKRTIIIVLSVLGAGLVGVAGFLCYKKKDVILAKFRRRSEQKAL